MKSEDHVIFRWDGKPVPKGSAESQREIDEYEEYHMSHPEYYPGDKYCDGFGNIIDEFGNILEKNQENEEE
ncbi:MAG: hypothetical protein RR646_02525 [Erysipelotrichaceae bacterium]